MKTRDGATTKKKPNAAEQFLSNSLRLGETMRNKNFSPVGEAYSKGLEMSDSLRKSVRNKRNTQNQETIKSIRNQQKQQDIQNNRKMIQDAMLQQQKKKKLSGVKS